MGMAKDSKIRFSDRVADYVKWRPSYPEAAIQLLFERLGLRGGADVVADIGSGTGIFARLLAGRVGTIYAVEPNREMRAAAEEALSGVPGFTSVDASAEVTTLSDASVDLIVCAQAFHWFDRTACKREFARILKPGGYAALIWNRRLDGSPFSQAYEKLLGSLGGEYQRVDHKKLLDSDFAAFFKDGIFTRSCFPYAQKLDFEGLLGRGRSSSYVPLPGTEGYERFEKSLKKTFDEFNVEGLVEIPYRTEVIWGRL